MRRLSAGGVPLLLMCYFLSAALCSSSSTTTSSTKTATKSTTTKRTASTMTGKLICLGFFFKDLELSLSSEIIKMLNDYQVISASGRKR